MATRDVSKSKGIGSSPRLLINEQSNKEDDWEIVAQLMQFFCWNERL